MEQNEYNKKLKEVKKWKRKVFHLVESFTKESVSVLDLNNYSEKLKEARNEYDIIVGEIDDIIGDLEENDELDRIKELEAIQNEMKGKVNKNEKEVKEAVVLLKNNSVTTERDKKVEEIQKTWPSEHQEEVQHALVLSLAAFEENPREYLEGEMPNHNFTSLIKSENGDCHFLLAEEHDNNRLYLSFRGTTDMKDVNKDLQLFLKESESKLSGGKFHSGFLARAEQFPLKKVLTAKQFSKKRLIVCGHSLGGAVSSIVMTQILLEKEIFQDDDIVGDVINITFGSPLFGEMNAKRLLDEKKYSSRMFHFVAEKDPVPSLLSMTQSISAMSNIVENQIRNIVGSVSQEKMNILLEKKLQYQKCLSGIVPAMDPLLKLARIISPTSPAVIAAKGVYDIVSMITTVDDDKVRNTYTPIGNYFFLFDTENKMKFFSTDVMEDVRKALDTLEDSFPEYHKLINYRELCSKNKAFYSNQYPEQREVTFVAADGSDFQVLNPRRIQGDNSFSPWIRSAELGMMETSPDEVILRLVLHGMNLSEIIPPECKFELGFPFGQSEIDTKVKSINFQQEKLKPHESKTLEKLGISVTGNIEDIVVEQVMKMSAKDISEKLSASDHGTKITVATQFGHFEYSIPRNKFGREIKPPSLAQLAKHESIALVIRKSLQRTMAIGQVKGTNIEKQPMLKEILALAELTLPSQEYEELTNILKTKDIQKVLSNEEEYKKIDQICNAIGNKIKANINIEIEKTLWDKVLIGSLALGAAGAMGYIAGPGLLVLGAVDALSKTAIVSAAATGGATTGYMANRYFTEQFSESSYNKALQWITTQLYGVYDKSDKDCTEISDLIHDNSTYSTEKALLQMFDKEKTLGDNFKGSSIEKTTEDTKKAIQKRIDCIRSLHEIRNILATQCFIGLVGLQDAGKTTLLNSIWGLQKVTGLFDHTEVPELYEITNKVSIIDFPGSNSLEYHRKTFSNCGAMNNMIILLVPFNGDIHAHVCDEVAKVYEVMAGSESCKVLICINKCGEKLQSLKQELKLKGENDPLGYMRNRYVDKLNEQFTNKPWIRIKQEHLLFTDWKADQEAVDFGIKTVNDVKNMIKKFLVDLKVMRSMDYDELEAAVSPK